MSEDRGRNRTGRQQRREDKRERDKEGKKSMFKIVAKTPYVQSKLHSKDNLLKAKTL